MDFINNPTVRQVLILLGVANGAVLSYTGTPQAVKLVCGIVAAILSAVLGASAGNLSKQLSGARAENLALQQKLSSVQEASK